MRKLTGKTVIGCKRKLSDNDKENQPFLPSTGGSAGVTVHGSKSSVSDNEPLPGRFMARSLFTPINVSKNVTVPPSPFAENEVPHGGTPLSAITNVTINPSLYILNSAIGAVTPLTAVTDVHMRTVSSSSNERPLHTPSSFPLPSLSRRPLPDITNVNMRSVSSSSNERPLHTSSALALTSSSHRPLADITNVGGPSHIRRKRVSQRTSLTSTGQDLNTEFEQVGSQTQNDGIVKYAHYLDLGDASHTCNYCGALFWREERTNKNVTRGSPIFTKCCFEGKIQLPRMKDPPPALYDLFFSDTNESTHFLQNIRRYNSMFCFTSMGGKIDTSVNTGTGPPVFRISGQNYHSIGSLVPQDGTTPKFAQLYIYDTDNEINNRIKSVRRDSSSGDIHEEIVDVLKNLLDQNNVLVNSFRMARTQIQTDPVTDVKMKLIGRRSQDGRNYNLPTASEVAALIVGDLDPSVGVIDILVESKSGQLRRINQLNPAYLPLQYPLLYPYGEDGYREDIKFSDSWRERHPRGRIRISPKEYFSFYIHEKVNEKHILLYGRRLLQQFLVDAYTMIESARLVYIRTHQKALRCEVYKGLSEALTRGDLNPAARGKRIILPSSFTGGARYMIQNYQDAMAICKHIGYPHLFITFTCNPKWPEIERYVGERGLNPEDRPDIICRVYKMKLDALIADIKTKKLFGEIVGVIYTVEFQKRGLPHAHILLFANRMNRADSANEIDALISAEIPDRNTEPEYHDAVNEFMLHGPCGEVRKNSPCMVEGKCSKYFPKKYVPHTILDKDGYPVYRRRDNGATMSRNGIDLDNRYVVAHNKQLLLKYRAHINVEWCNQSRSIKYLFKYVNKGHDRVTTEFMSTSSNDRDGNVVDEINMYYDCRYISACEAIWRIFGYEIHSRSPPVERLNFHLEDQQTVYFSDDQPLDEVVEEQTVKQSQFKAWFKANEIYSQARSLTYAEFPSKFVWKQDVREWHPRKQGFSIGRLFYVPPGCGEIYYLRCLLNLVRGPTSHEDIRTVAGVIHKSYRDACYAYGLLDDDKEYIDGITESSFWSTAYALRRLFAMLLTSNSITRPEVVWNAVWEFLAEDAQFHRRRLMRNQDLVLSDFEKEQFALVELEKLLSLWGKSLRDFPEMPIPNESSMGLIENTLLCEELAYDKDSLKTEHDSLLAQLTDEQKNVYDAVMNDVDSNKGGLFFVYGYGGTGKTFVWRTLSAKIRSQGDIVLNVASSGIASLLLPGGRTAHSRFAIPLSLNEDSTCNISQGSDLAELIIRSKLIIWDEAPMTHKHCFEALDKTMRDLMRFASPDSAGKTFGGKTVVFGGDFRQILPVIPKATRPEVVGATINSSYLWKNCKVFRLTKNLRLRSLASEEDRSAVESFSKWIADIGDGIAGGQNNGISDIDIPEQFLLKSGSDPIATIVENTFPNARSGTLDPSHLEGRAILSPTLDVVDQINQYMCDMNTAEGRTYLSSDSLCRADSGGEIMSEIHTPEFLNGLRLSGVPNHSLTLKIGAPVMLLRNIDHSLGLCNGTRLIVSKLTDHIVEAKIVAGTYAGTTVLIPRMTLTPTDTRLPFKFQRKQFPLMLAYAMTINKSQGQTLTRVGLFLRKPVFNHGQLYVAFSRVTHPNGLKIISLDDNGEDRTTTTNVVYKEVFNNV